jgi:hypothetical protein
MNPSNFWVEFIKRLLSDNPKFFKYIQWVSLAVSAITGLPELLTYFGVHLTGYWLTFENKTLAACGLVALLLSRLPNADPNTKADNTVSK